MHTHLPKERAGMEIDHAGPATCKDCGRDAYIRLAGAEDYVCAHCFGDRGRTGRKGGESSKASQSPPTGSAGGAAR